MKQNKYDDRGFFDEYKKMARSRKGLEGAGEWHILKEMLPVMEGKDMLDLGCGYGWHCIHAAENGAKSVVGVDISEKMLGRARELNNHPNVSFRQSPIENIDFREEQFDFILSSLAFHYVEPFEEMCRKIYTMLKPEGRFVFSVEHPIFTSRNEQEWFKDDKGDILHWPVDHYQDEGKRETAFLSEDVIKYHRTVATYINGIVDAGFSIKQVSEPVPSKDMLETNPEMKDELRRPMFLMISAEK